MYIGKSKYVCDGCENSGSLCNPTQPNCPDGCSCKKATTVIVTSKMDKRYLNPASRQGYGFTNNFDGRIRGGIKTPDAFKIKNNRI